MQLASCGGKCVLAGSRYSTAQRYSVDKKRRRQGGRGSPRGYKFQDPDCVPPLRFCIRRPSIRSPEGLHFSFVKFTATESSIRNPSAFHGRRNLMASAKQGTNQQRVQEGFSQTETSSSLPSFSASVMQELEKRHGIVESSHGACTVCQSTEERLVPHPIISHENAEAQISHSKALGIFQSHGMDVYSVENCVLSDVSSVAGSLARAEQTIKQPVPRVTIVLLSDEAP